MVSITANYPRSRFIRQGTEKIKTCYITEAQYPGNVMNLVDMTEFDQGDTDLGIFLNDLYYNTNAASQASASQAAFYIPLNDCAGVEVLMTEANVGSITKGAHVKVTTGGEITTWTYVDGVAGSDTVRDVIGQAAEAIAQNSTGWVKLGRL